MTVALPPSDPADLASFPAKTLSPDYPNIRLHHVSHDAEWFCTDRDCRFEPPAGAAFGTCYLAGNPLGAYVGKFGRLSIVTRSLVDQQVLAKLQLRSSLDPSVRDVPPHLRIRRRRGGKPKHRRAGVHWSSTRQQPVRVGPAKAGHGSGAPDPGSASSRRHRIGTDDDRSTGFRADNRPSPDAHRLLPFPRRARAANRVFLDLDRLDAAVEARTA